MLAKAICRAFKVQVIANFEPELPEK